MDIIRFDTKKEYGTLRRMNAVNNGPIYKRHANDQNSGGNLALYKALRIPYARNHDANHCPSYGGPYTVDISAIFPNFDADENDPASYDFACTDEYIAITALAETETFYRLGQSIEHRIKKYHIFPPKDTAKWARICEHVIMHYNHGWADGYEYGLKYWEIWNEPDLDVNTDNKRTWAGTVEEFYELYSVTANHLKTCFPELKIGGPAIAGNLGWADGFLAEMRKSNVPLDFFSWHIYAKDIEKVTERANAVRQLMIKHGYGDAESILNEWNYVRGWQGEDWKYSLKSEQGLKGGSFILAAMAACQKYSDVDMLMYYDARPGNMNGIFDRFNDPEPGYYSLLWFADLKDNGTEIRSEMDPENIYSLATKSQDGKICAALTYYTEDDETSEPKTVSLDFGRGGCYEVYLLDENHDAELISTTDTLVFNMKPLSAIMIKEI